MEQPLPPPVVTIVDPLHPGALGDVMVSGNEREPFRMTRRHWQAVALVVALVAAVVLPAKAISSRARDARVALAEADQVSFTTDASEGHAVALTNDADGDVRLLEIQLLAPGYEAVRLDRTIRGLTSAVLELPDTRTCERAMMRREPYGEARVTVRTAHGAEVERTIDLTTAWFVMQLAAQERCGWLPPDSGVDLDLATWVRRGPALFLVGSLHNRSKARMVVDAFSVDVGTGPADVGTVRPIDLAPGATVPVSLRMTLPECPPGLDDLFLPAHVQAGVTAPGDPEVRGFPDFGVGDPGAFEQWLQEGCP